MATTSTSTAETSTSDYLIPDDSQELFQNITTFAKNMTLKDSVLYEEAETTTSKWMGSLLLKYYEHTLTLDDVRNLLMFVGIYNKTISDKVSIIENILLTQTATESTETANNESKLFFLKLLGMYTGQDYTSSFLNLLVESFIADNYEEHPDWIDKKAFISYIFFCLMFDYNSLCIGDYISSFTDPTSYEYNVDGLESITVDTDTIKIEIDNLALTRSNIVTSLFNKYYGIVFSILYKIASDEGYPFTDDSGSLDTNYFLNIFSISNYSFIGSGSSDDDNTNAYLILNDISDITRNGQTITAINSQTLSGVDDSESISNLDYISSLTFMRDVITVSTDAEIPYIDLLNSTFSTDYLEIFEAILDYTHENRSSLITIILNLIGKEKYIFYQTSYGQETYGSSSKLMASELERKYANAGYCLNFFDIRVPFDSVSGILSNSSGLYDFTTGINLGVTSPSSISTLPRNISEVTDGSDGMVCILIAYKELNTEYRNTMRADLLDYSLYKQRINMRKVISTSELAYTAVSIDAANYARTAADDLVILRDYRSSEDSSVISTSKLFEYQYTNAYICRSSVESDCISYYIADPYISDRYGRYTYQETEINNFLTLFKETRDFYYRVLLNESFTKESEYFLYEKTFIIFFTIERFLTSKLDNLKDIDSFDLTDTKNFLISYGFESLVDILNVSSFYSSEELSKRLIQYYVDLTSYKGSRKVIDTLQDVFSLPNGTLTIYKELLAKVKSEDGTYEYRFVRISEDNENIYEELMTCLSASISLENFVEDDKYWDASNTPDSTLVDVGLHWSNTKYIIPEVVSEISEIYVVTRCVFELIDYMFDTMVEDGEESTLLSNLIVEDDENLEADYNISMKEYITAIRGLFRSYLEIKFKSVTNYYSEYYDTIFGHSSVTYEIYPLSTNEEDYAAGNTLTKTKTDVSFKLGTSYDPTTKDFTSNFKKLRLENLELPKFYMIDTSDPQYTYQIAVNPNYVKGFFRCSTVSSEDDSCYTQSNQMEIILDALIPILISDGLLDDLVEEIIESYGTSIMSYLASLPASLSTSTEKVLNGLVDILPKDVETRNVVYKILKSRYGIDLTSETLNLNPISLLDSTENEDDDSLALERETLITNYFRSNGYATSSSAAISQDGLREYCTNYLHLPLIIINGSVFDEPEYDAKGIAFMQKLYEGIYLDESVEDTEHASDDRNHNILYSSVLAGATKLADDTFADGDTDTMANVLISMCSNLSSILNQTIQLNLTESQNALISFLSEAIAYFISYTSCVYDFYYMNSYDSKGESTGLTDKFAVITRRAAVDSVYYDESVKVTIAKRK